MANSSEWKLRETSIELKLKFAILCVCEFPSIISTLLLAGYGVYQESVVQSGGVVLALSSKSFLNVLFSFLSFCVGVDELCELGELFGICFGLFKLPKTGDK